MTDRRPHTLLRLFACLPVILLAACGGEADAPGALVMDQHEYERWEIALVEMRIEKNDAFMVPESTPLPDASREGFVGLNYYFPESALRFRTPFETAASADTVRLTKRKGNVVSYVVRGHVRFHHEGRNHSLAVFGPVEPAGEDYLWLPFFDATNQDETYPGGRYIDVALDADGMVDLDFNYAYNPLCDYNPDKYNCTLPPVENTLGFPVKAGEMRYSTGH
ncbi:MAG: DUF1684 domain-containing protein [bacterium]|nr:DUF1684 domain-containing protein [bacterium]